MKNIEKQWSSELSTIELQFWINLSDFNLTKKQWDELSSVQRIH